MTDRNLRKRAVTFGALLVASSVACGPSNPPPRAEPRAPTVDYEAERRADEERRAKELATAKEDAVAYFKAARAGTGPLSTVLDVAPDEHVPRTLNVYFGAGLWDRLAERARKSLVLQAQALWQKTHCPTRPVGWQCLVDVAAYDGETVVHVAHTSGLDGTTVNFDR